jgi:hypothetical protein
MCNLVFFIFPIPAKRRVCEPSVAWANVKIAMIVLVIRWLNADGEAALLMPTEIIA